MTEIDDGDRPLAGVREGMKVVDSSGEDVGTVDEVRMSDPGAVTAQGQGTGTDDGLLGSLADAFTDGPDVPPQTQERLARAGYLRVDVSGLFSGNRYVASDQVASVQGDVVRLSVDKDQLVG